MTVSLNSDDVLAGPLPEVPLTGGEAVPPGLTDALVGSAASPEAIAAAQAPLYALLGRPGPDEIVIPTHNTISRRADKTADDMNPALSPELRERAAEIHNDIVDAGGLDADIVQDVIDAPGLRWSDVLDPGLYLAAAPISQASGTVTHRHYLYVPADGSDAMIINAGPSSDAEAPDVNGVDQTKLKTYVSSLEEFFGGTTDRIGSTWHLYAANVGSDVDLDATWAGMEATAREVGDAGLNYHSAWRRGPHEGPAAWPQQL